MIFKNILYFLGSILIACGILAIIANNLPVMEVPEYPHGGNIITGVILLVIGSYIFLLGILENRK